MLYSATVLQLHNNIDKTFMKQHTFMKLNEGEN